MDSFLASQQHEHRLVMRVLAQWRALADGHGLPRRSQMTHAPSARIGGTAC